MNSLFILLLVSLAQSAAKQDRIIMPLTQSSSAVGEGAMARCASDTPRFQNRSLHSGHCYVM